MISAVKATGTKRKTGRRQTLESPDRSERAVDALVPWLGEAWRLKRGIVGDNSWNDLRAVECWQEARKKLIGPAAYRSWETFATNGGWRSAQKETQGNYALEINVGRLKSQRKLR
jgi:hypothetical protein